MTSNGYNNKSNKIVFQKLKKLTRRLSEQNNFLKHCYSCVLMFVLSLDDPKRKQEGIFVKNIATNEH